MDKKYFRPVTASDANNGNRNGIPSKVPLKRPGTALGVSTDHESRKSHSLKVSSSKESDIKREKKLSALYSSLQSIPDNQYTSSTHASRTDITVKYSPHHIIHREKVEKFIRFEEKTPKEMANKRKSRQKSIISSPNNNKENYCRIIVTSPSKHFISTNKYISSPSSTALNSDDSGTQDQQIPKADKGSSHSLTPPCSSFLWTRSPAKSDQKSPTYLDKTTNVKRPKSPVKPDVKRPKSPAKPDVKRPKSPAKPDVKLLESLKKLVLSPSMNPSLRAAREIFLIQKEEQAKSPITTAAYEIDIEVIDSQLDSYADDDNFSSHTAPVPQSGRVSSLFSNRSTSGSHTSRIEDRINLDHMQMLKKHFDRSVTEDGESGLSMEMFIMVMSQLLNLSEESHPQLTALFMKIDSGSHGHIPWDAFCTYMQLELTEKEDSYTRAREVCFETPAVTKPTPHRDTIHRVCVLPDHSYVTASQDGVVAFWNPASLHTKRTRLSPDANKSKQKWITDFAMMTNSNRFILSTGDRELQFFETSTFEPYCQISGLESVPLKMSFWHNPRNPEESILMYGDNQGCVNVLVIPNTTLAFRKWKQEAKVDGVPTANIEKVSQLADVRYARWEVHKDWVVELKYEDHLRSIISCSNDPSTGIVIGNVVGSTNVESALRDSNMKRGVQSNSARKRLSADQTVFYVYKGVKTFDYSEKYNVLATGGMDRLVRIWNPYVNTKPTALLRGHNGPIFHLFICDKEQRIYSISTDKTVKVWDAQDHSQLCTVGMKTHMVQGEMTAVLYNEFTKAIAITTDSLSVLNLKENRYSGQTEATQTHRDTIHAIKYNPHFKQIVTACNSSMIKVWDLETGQPVFEFNNAHGNSAVTSMIFDSSGRRLVTGGRDGVLRIWNYNNGQCLRTLKKLSNEEVTCVIHVTVSKNKYIVCVGWDRRINVFTDTTDSIHHEQHALPHWVDDERRGHTEDILAVSANSATNHLATSSYDGEILIWSLVSGHIFCRLKAPPPDPTKPFDPMEGDAAVGTLVFLPARGTTRRAATLIACGPGGYIHFWNIYKGGKIMSNFTPSSEGVCIIAVNSTNTVLASGDAKGHVKLYNISEYCVGGTERSPPPILSHWRAHTSSITCFEFVSGVADAELLLSGSDDCSARLWTGKGHYVGTLGQTTRWDIDDTESYAHPRVPRDVLSEPIEIPEKVRKSIDNTTTYMDTVQQQKNNTFQDIDLTIEYSEEQGARVRHIKHKPVASAHEGPAVYHSLPCFELTDVPPSRQAPVIGSLDPLSILDAVEIESICSEDLELKPFTPKLGVNSRSRRHGHKFNGKSR